MDIPSFKVEFIPKIGMYNLFSPKKEYKEVDLCIISNKNKEFLEFLIDESIGKSFYIYASDVEVTSQESIKIKLIDYDINIDYKYYKYYNSNISIKELLLNNPIETDINLKYNRILE